MVGIELRAGSSDGEIAWPHVSGIGGYRRLTHGADAAHIWPLLKCVGDELEEQAPTFPLGCDRGCGGEHLGPHVSI